MCIRDRRRSLPCTQGMAPQSVGSPALFSRYCTCGEDGIPSLCIVAAKTSLPWHIAYGFRFFFYRKPVWRAASATDSKAQQQRQLAAFCLPQAAPVYHAVFTANNIFTVYHGRNRISIPGSNVKGRRSHKRLPPYQTSGSFAKPVSRSASVGTLSVIVPLL